MPQRETSVCFTGHRALSAAEDAELRRSLPPVLEAAWALGYRRFYNGGALGFDLLAAESVVALRERHSDVRLEIVIPHGHQSDGWPIWERTRYERIRYLSDERTVLSPRYYQGCYHVRNRYMVDRAGLCLCYFTHAQGGTASTVAYASRENVRIVNLGLECSWQTFVREAKKNG